MGGGEHSSGHLPSTSPSLVSAPVCLRSLHCNLLEGSDGGALARGLVVRGAQAVVGPPRDVHGDVVVFAAGC